MSTITQTLAYDDRTQRTIARLAGAPDRLIPAIARGLAAGARLAADHIIVKRLSGPSSVADGRLGYISHTLQRSLRPEQSVGPVQMTGDGARISIGTNVKYAAVHEFGFHGKVTVREHTRRQFATSKRPRTDKNGRVSLRSYKVAVGAVTVRSHDRMMNIPARHWLGGGMADEAQTFCVEIRGAIQKDIIERGNA